VPLTWLDGKPIGFGMAGELTKELLAAYKNLINEAIGEVSSFISGGG